MQILELQRHLEERRLQNHRDKLAMARLQQEMARQKTETHNVSLLHVMFYLQLTRKHLCQDFVLHFRQNSNIHCNLQYSPRNFKRLKFSFQFYYCMFNTIYQLHVDLQCYHSVVHLNQQILMLKGTVFESRIQILISK